jgi:hypothetical protein
VAILAHNIRGVKDKRTGVLDSFSKFVLYDVEIAHIKKLVMKTRTGLLSKALFIAL